MVKRRFECTRLVKRNRGMVPTGRAYTSRLHFRHTSYTVSSDRDAPTLASAGGSSCRVTFVFFAGFERVCESCDASSLTEAGAGLVLTLGLALASGNDCGGGCNTVTGTGDCTCRMEILSPSQVPVGRGVGSGRRESSIFVNALSRRACMDLSNINSVAAVRCQFRPEEELLMRSDSKAPSTECFSLDWKSSCCISLTSLWLWGSYVSTTGRQEL